METKHLLKVGDKVEVCGIIIFDEGVKEVESFWEAVVEKKYRQSMRIRYLFT